ncbi:hypothetical protein BKA70DRAFT_1451037 [Coprinopsis sp. MPI-PUGE-AT-0042]|nr:hypothetical protein BKA70DRAFT_1451037 [Coprinopsis sp. MPI-PUGE-AT-0042]
MPPEQGKAQGSELPHGPPKIVEGNPFRNPEYLRGLTLAPPSRVTNPFLIASPSSGTNATRRIRNTKGPSGQSEVPWSDHGGIYQQEYGPIVNVEGVGIAFSGFNFGHVTQIDEFNVLRNLPIHLDISGHLNETAGHPPELVLCVLGKVGVGKSTLAKHLATRLEKDKRLAANIFLGFALPDWSAESVVRMAAGQLCGAFPALTRAVCEAIRLDVNPSVSLETRIQALILEPIRSLGLPYPLVILLDALDQWAPHPILMRALTCLPTETHLVRFVAFGRQAWKNPSRMSCSEEIPSNRRGSRLRPDVLNGSSSLAAIACLDTPQETRYEAEPASDIILRNSSQLPSKNHQGWVYTLVALLIWLIFLARMAFSFNDRYFVSARRTQDAIQSLQLISNFNGLWMELELDHVQDHHHSDEQAALQASLSSSSVPKLASPSTPLRTARRVWFWFTQLLSWTPAALLSDAAWTWDEEQEGVGAKHPTNFAFIAVGETSAPAPRATCRGMRTPFSSSSYQSFSKPGQLLHLGSPPHLQKDLKQLPGTWRLGLSEPVQLESAMQAELYDWTVEIFSTSMRGWQGLCSVSKGGIVMSQTPPVTPVPEGIKEEGARRELWIDGLQESSHSAHDWSLSLDT